MKRTLLFVSVTLALIAGACSQKSATTTPSSSPTTGSSPAKTASKANEKKAPATNPVPADWIRMYDDVKGYEFMVPQGTDHKSQTVEGVDVYLANVPAPYEIGISVVAFQDTTLTKDDVLKRAENILKNLGEKDIKVGDAKELSADYSL